MRKTKMPLLAVYAGRGRARDNVPADQTDTWYHQLEAELQVLGITGLTDTVRQAVVSPEDGVCSLPAPARLLHVLRQSSWPPT